VISEERGEAAGTGQCRILRYSRHLILPEVNMEGQKKLKAAKVLCIGRAGLGSPLALYLAAAGVGTIGIVDFDTVDLTTSSARIIHGTKDVGRPKNAVGEGTLQDINPHVNVSLRGAVHSENAHADRKDFDIVIDGRTISLPLSDQRFCVLLGKPNVYGSSSGLKTGLGFWAEKGPCYAALSEPPPPGLVPPARRRRMGVLPGIVGCLQANRHQTYSRPSAPAHGRLMLFNALIAVPRTKIQKTRTVRLRRAPHDHRTDRLRGVSAAFARRDGAQGGWKNPKRSL